jgi:1-acyl-sn-glycerol-3-phosphate acyltransferase
MTGIAQAATPAGTSASVRVYRFTRLIAHVVLGLAISAFVFPWVGNKRQLRIIRWWSKGMLATMAVKVTVHGRHPAASHPTLLVSNHVSWLDVWVILSVHPVRFVAKSDIAGWPLAGWLVKQAGTIFIERARRSDTARINQRIADVMARPETVAVFPEGTTTDGTQLRAFHASLFQPALSPGARLAAAAIRYPLRDGSPNVDASYAGDRSLLQSLRLILAQRVVRAELRFLGYVDPVGKSRRELAVESRAIIAQGLEPWVHRSPHGTAAGHPAVVP